MPAYLSTAPGPTGRGPIRSRTPVGPYRGHSGAGPRMPQNGRWWGPTVDLGPRRGIPDRRAPVDAFRARLAHAGRRALRSGPDRTPALTYALWALWSRPMRHDSMVRTRTVYPGRYPGLTMGPYPGPGCYRPGPCDDMPATMTLATRVCRGRGPRERLTSTCGAIRSLAGARCHQSAPVGRRRSPRARTGPDRTLRRCGQDARD